MELMRELLAQADIHEGVDPDAAPKFCDAMTQARYYEKLNKDQHTKRALYDAQKHFPAMTDANKKSYQKEVEDFQTLCTKYGIK